MSKGIAIGIGFAIGIILAILIIGFIVVAIVKLYKYSLRNNFSIELFKNYYQELVNNERFEEMPEVRSIIKRLRKKDKPKDLLQKYEVDVDTYLYWMPTYDGGERLVFRHDKRIIKKKPKKKEDDSKASGKEENSSN